MVKALRAPSGNVVESFVPTLHFFWAAVSLSTITVPGAMVLTVPATRLSGYTSAQAPPRPPRLSPAPFTSTGYWSWLAVEPTPGTLPILASSSGDTRWNWPEIAYSPRKFPSSTALPTDAFRDDAKTVTPVTRATPMVMAAAVAAVRRGLRTVLALASLP